MTEFPFDQTDNQIVASFFATVCQDLDTVIGLREDLFWATPPGLEDLRGLLLAEMGNAWDEARATIPGVLDALGPPDADRYPDPDEPLRTAGLTGAQLKFKVLAWREARVELVQAFDDSDDQTDPPETIPEIPPEVPTDPPLPSKKPRWLKWALKKLEKAMGAADTLLVSLTGVLQLSEPVQEVKDAVEKLAGKVADSLPDGPSTPGAPS